MANWRELAARMYGGGTSGEDIQRMMDLMMNQQNQFGSPSGIDYAVLAGAVSDIVPLQPPREPKEDYFNNPGLRKMISQFSEMGTSALSGTLGGPSYGTVSGLAGGGLTGGMLGTTVPVGDMVSGPALGAVAGGMMGTSGGGIGAATGGAISGAGAATLPLMGATSFISGFLDAVLNANKNPFSKAQQYQIGKITQQGVDLVEQLRKSGMSEYDIYKWALDKGMIPQGTKEMKQFAAPEQIPGVNYGEIQGTGIGGYGPMFSGKIGAMYSPDVWQNMILPTQGGTYPAYSQRGTNYGELWGSDIFPDILSQIVSPSSLTGYVSEEQTPSLLDRLSQIYNGPKVGGKFF